MGHGRVFAIAQPLRDLPNARAGARWNLRVVPKCEENGVFRDPARRAISVMVGWVARIDFTVK
jgi:hypothetical protein